MAPSPRLSTRADISALVPPRETPFGRLHLAEQRQPRPLKPCLASLAALALAPELEEVDPERLFFLDTETTGLSGGTGTLAFLIGTASYEGDSLAVQQLHLPGPGQERPMLLWLADKLSMSSALVTFNGKSFDWPLLRSRFVMNRLPVPKAIPHLDLLHCARRVFRHQLSEVKLGTLETEILKIRRQGDIGGAEIPSAWFDYLRTGRVATLARVLEHNVRDVLSMVDLAELLVTLWKRERAVTPKIALGLATVASRNREDGLGLHFTAIAAGSANVKVRLAALELEASLRKRNGDPRAAVRALESALHLTTEPAELHLSLAKLYEHRLRDLVAARRHAELAGEAEDPATHQRRRSRLQRLEQLPLQGD